MTKFFSIYIFLFFSISINLFSYEIDFSYTKLFQPDLLSASNFENNPEPSGILIDNSITMFDNRLKKIRINDTTYTKGNRITNLWGSGEIRFVSIELEDYGTEISLKIYNMLGKEVILVYEGTAKPRGVNYDFQTDILPNGIYFCIMHGRDFKDAYKFIISR